MSTVHLQHHFAQLDRVAEQFGWLPSPEFRKRLTRFAYSVGSSNIDDLFSLAAYTAWERYQVQPAAVTAAKIEFEKAILCDLDRERQKWRRIAKRSQAELRLDSPTGPDDDPVCRAVAGETGERLWQAIRSLSADEQALLMDRFGHGLDYEQIAAIREEKVSLEALRARFSRAIRRLRDILAHPAEG